MKTKLILIALASLFTAGAQVKYYKNTNANSFALVGGMAKTKNASLASGGMSIGIETFEFGATLSKQKLHLDDEDVKVTAITPFLEFTVIRAPDIALSAGMAFPHFMNKKTNVQLVPLYASLVLDMSKSPNGFVVMPDITISKTLSFGGSSGKSITFGLGLAAMFRNEKDASFLFMPYFSKNSELSSPVFGLTIGVLAR